MGGEFFNLIDQLSYLPRLYINGKDRYVTKLGVLLSIISFICVTGLGLYFIINYFQKQTFTIVSYIDKNSEYTSIIFDGSPIFFRLRYANEKPLDERYAYINATYWIKDTDNNRKLNKTLNLEKCSKQKHFDPESRNSVNFTVDSYWCIKNDGTDYPLAKSSVYDTEAYLNIYAIMCTNSTENKNYCFDKDTITNHLNSNSVYLDVYLPNAIPNHFNTTDPIQYPYMKKSIKINLMYKLSYKFYFSSIVYVSDNGMVFENNETREAFESRSDPIDIVSSFLNKDAFLNIQINTEDNSKSYYKRSYPKLQTVVASIGGVYSFITTVAGFIANFVTQKMMFMEISNKSMDLEVNQHKNYQTELKTIIQNLIKNEETNNKMNDRSNVSESINLNFLIGNKLKDHSKNSKIRKLTILESILPKKYLHKESLAHLVDKCLETLKNMLSCEFILSEFSSFEKLKNLILDKNHLNFYENISNPSLEYYDNKLKSKNKPTIEEMTNYLRQIIKRNDCISNTFIKNFIEN